MVLVGRIESPTEARICWVVAPLFLRMTMNSPVGEKPVPPVELGPWEELLAQNANA